MCSSPRPDDQLVCTKKSGSDFQHVYSTLPRCGWCRHQSWKTPRSYRVCAHRKIQGGRPPQETCYKPTSWQPKFGATGYITLPYTTTRANNASSVFDREKSELIAGEDMGVRSGRMKHGRHFDKTATCLGQPLDSHPQLSKHAFPSTEFFPHCTTWSPSWTITCVCCYGML